MRKRYVRRSDPKVIMAFVAATLVLGACTASDVGSDTTTVEPGATSTTEAPDPGSTSTAPTPGSVDKVTARQPEAVQSVDPLNAPGFASQQIVVLTSGQLFRYDAEGVPQPELASDLTRSSDGLTITVTLRDAVYSDGTPVTADDVVLAFDRQDFPEFATGQFMAAVESAEATSEDTVQFNMAQPDPEFETNLAHHVMAIHPAARISDEGEDYFLSPVSAGPYVVADGWEPGSNLVPLVENPNYINGPMAISAIDFVAVPDVTNAMLQLEQGSLDWAFGVPASQLEAGLSDDVRLFAHPIGGTFHLASVLATDGPLGDPLVQEAMSYAVNRQDIVDRAFFGVTQPATAFTYSSSPLHIDSLPDGGEQNLDRARELMAEAGYADGFDAVLVTIGERDGHTNSSLLIAEHLSEIGIRVEVEPVEISAWVDRMVAGDFDLTFQGNVGRALQQFRNWFCQDSWGSFTRYSLEFEGATYEGSDPAACDLANEALSSPDPESLQGYAEELEAIATSTWPAIPLADRIEIIGSRISEGLFEVVPNNTLIRVATAQEVGGS